MVLGSWKVLGAIALLVPRRALLKEWAYAGAFFAYTGAIVSHLTTGYDLGEVGLLAVLTVLTHPNNTPELSRGLELFNIIKTSIVQAYYTSEVGALQELKYQTNPFQPGFPGCANHGEHSAT